MGFRGRSSGFGHVRAGSVESVLAHCHQLSRRGLSYREGSNDPGQGGIDCAGTVQLLLLRQQIAGVPRQAGGQFQWLRRSGRLYPVGDGEAGGVLRRLRAGDLLFWEAVEPGISAGAGHGPHIAQVMVYIGFDRASGRHLMFGASSGNGAGLTGHGVDYFEMPESGDLGRGRLVAFGRPPGLL